MATDLKSLVLRAGDNFSAMYEAADSIARSKDASSEQVEAAKAVRRSIAAVMTKTSDMRVQVAQQRYAKLIGLL